jgi:hypothetical protein
MATSLIPKYIRTSKKVLVSGNSSYTFNTEENAAYFVYTSGQAGADVTSLHMARNNSSTVLHIVSGSLVTVTSSGNTANNTITVNNISSLNLAVFVFRIA